MTPDPVEKFLRETPLGIQFVVVAVLGVLLSLVWDGATRWPTPWVIPMEGWVTDFITWLKRDASILGVQFKDITRGVGAGLKEPVNWVDYVLVRGSKLLGLKQLPWIGVVAGITIFAHWVGGWRLTLLTLLSFLYVVFFGLWKDAMRTMTIVVVAVPMASLIGLGLGVWVTRSKRAAAIITPMFDLMQATPHLAYLPPVAALFSFGPVAALIATVIFAMPPMARCTILGLQSVPSDIIESGRMSGCTQRQLLWKVALPSAHRTLMLGVNQVVMQTFAMVVIASIVGASGLGQKLLYSLQQLKIGAAIEQGLAITLIAIVLDRITQAYAARPKDHEHTDLPWTTRHKHLLLFLAVMIGSYVAALFLSELRLLPRKMTITFGTDMDDSIRAFNVVAFDYINPIRDFVTIYILLPIRDFCLWLPWPVFVGVIAVAAWRLGRWPVLLLCVALAMSFIVTGFWVEAMKTTYLVLVSGILCLAIGVPMGIWCARSDRVARITMSVCDTLQTFPSFIYLIPAIMLFRVGDFANVFAIIPYATVPAIRFTYLGLKRIPPVTIEAAIANGATPRQRLFKVELPIAIPEIMLGVNQTIMMALAMTAITALIGSTDLGQAVVRAISTQNFGRGILAGLFIAALGIIADRLIGAWADRRKKQLGME
jgi:glycine betaine/proline transport system permease protein